MSNVLVEINRVFGVVVDINFIMSGGWNISEFVEVV